MTSFWGDLFFNKVWNLDLSSIKWVKPKFLYMKTTIFPSAPFGGRSSDEIKSAYKLALKERVKQAYFFGSFARGEFRGSSDIDLMLVQDTELPFTKRGEQFLDLFDIYPALDLLVYTQKEFDRLIDVPSPGFWTSVKKEIVRFI